MNTDMLIASLEEAGLDVLDLRGKLPKHPTKKFATRDVSGLHGLVLHHAAADGAEMKDLEGIARYHCGPNHVSDTGCPGILYTLSILGDGTITVNHDLETATWSQGDASRPGDENKEFLACLVLGNFDSPSNKTGKQPTLAQISAALQLAERCFAGFGWDAGDLYGHFDFGKAACPGSTLETVIRAIRANAPKENLPSVYDLSTARGRQEALKKLGFDPGTPDGVWGSKSKAALVAYQRSAGLNPDALWGPLTERSIAASIAKETHQ